MNLLLLFFALVLFQFIIARKRIFVNAPYKKLYEFLPKKSFSPPKTRFYKLF